MEIKKAKEIKKVLEEGRFNMINHHLKEGKTIKISFDDILTLINELEKENKEQLKQFAERLKKKIYSLWSGRQLGELLCDIDETLKEFVGVEE